MPIPSLPPLPDRYRVGDLLGEGGMGRVYRAEDRELSRAVALKLLRTRSDEDRRRLVLEARTLGRLQHESIVELFDVGVAGGDIYFTMELLEGIPLDRLLPPSPPAEDGIKWAIALGVKVLAALEHVHARGIIHRDIKPSNIMVLGKEPGGSSTGGIDPAIKLLDFGLARERDPARRLAGASGTPLYMAPEQVLGNGADERSDIYSAGAVLYHLLTGRPPFGSLAGALRRNSAPIPPREAHPRLSEKASATLLSMIAREPHLRPSSAAEAREALLALLDPRRKARVLAPRLLPPAFVGRAAEMEKVLGFLSRTANGAGGSLHVAGEAGSGKTWLIQRTGLQGEALATHGLRPIRASFPRDGGTHEGLRRVFEEILDLIASASGPDAVRKALSPWGESLAAVLGIRTGTVPPSSLSSGGGPSPIDPDEASASPRLGEGRILEAAVQVVRAASETGPILLILEDIHQAGEWEIEIIARIERSLRGSGGGLLVTYRPDPRGASPLGKWVLDLDAEGRLDAVTLGPLTDRDVKDLIESMLRPAGQASARLISLIARRSEGSPAAATRWVEAYWERALLRRGSKGWDLAGKDAGDAIQAGALRRERIESLEPEALEVLSAAAVIGAPFEEGLISQVLGWNRSRIAGDVSTEGTDLRGILGLLTRKGLLGEDAEGYRPAPDLDEAAIEHLVPAETRRRLHERAGESLLEWHGRFAESHLFRIARHFERAGRDERALELHLAAARHAARSYANQRALEAYARARELSPAGPARGKIAEEMAELHTRLGEYRPAIDLFDEALAGASAAAPNEPGAERALLEKIGRLHQRRGDLARALAIFSRCLDESAGDLPARAQAHFRMGGIHLDRGDSTAARRHLEESLRLYQELGDFRQMPAIQSGLGLVEKQEDRLEAAVARFGEALRSAEKAGSLLEVAMTLNNLGNIHRALGNDPDAIDCLRRSIEARERAGDRQGLAICLNNIARIHFHRGDLLSARKATEAALALFEEIGDKKGVLIAGTNLGEILHVLGEFDRAAEILHSRLRLAERSGMQRLVEATLINLGSLHLDRGEYEVSADHLKRCLRTLPAEKPLELRAQALGILAAASLRLRDLEGAEDALREALEIANELKIAAKLGSLAAQRLRWHLERGEPEEALAAGKEILPRLERGPERLGAAQFRLELGRAYRALGPDWADQTEKHLLGALHDFEAMGSPHNAAAARGEIAIYWRLVGEEGEARTQLEAAAAEFRRLGLPRRLEEIERERTTP